MTSITPGPAFTAVTSQAMNDLVDKATLSGLTASVLASGVRFIKRVQGTPVDGDVNVDSTTGLLESYDGSAWSFDRTDPLELTMTNRSGTGMTAGDFVFADPANDDSFIMNPAAGPLYDEAAGLTCVGVLKANVADLASGTVYVRGVVNAYMRGSTTSFGWVSPPLPGNSFGVEVDPTSPPWTSGGQELMGIVLESLPVGTTTLVDVYLWR